MSDGYPKSVQEALETFSRMPGVTVTDFEALKAEVPEEDWVYQDRRFRWPWQLPRGTRLWPKDGFVIEWDRDDLHFEISGIGGPEVFAWGVKATKANTRCVATDWDELYGDFVGQSYDEVMAEDLTRLIDSLQGNELVMKCIRFAKNSSRVYRRTHGDSLEQVIPVWHGYELENSD